MLESRSLNTYYQLMKLQPVQLSWFIDMLNLSGRQFQYDVEKINSFLSDEGCHPSGFQQTAF